jgi:CRP-like cAMP-binding protein
VFHEGDPGDSVHLVRSGHLAVRISTPSGDTAIVNVLAPGQYFGELALLRREPPLERTATVVALDAAETLAVPRGAFDRLRRERPEVEHLLSQLLAERVDALSRRLIETLYLGVDRRIALRLVELATIYADGGGPIVVPLSQDVLADVAGATRPTVNQALKRLVAARAVELRRGRIVVPDLERLRAAARLP